MKPPAALCSAWRTLADYVGERRSRPGSCRLLLEALEDRTVLSGFLIASPTPGTVDTTVPNPSPVQSYQLSNGALSQVGQDQFAVSPDSNGFTSATSVAAGDFFGD